MKTGFPVSIPVMAWKQVDGDMSPETYGGTIAMGDGHAIELLKIQPVREYVGDREAQEVGFPFWTREAYFDLSDLLGDKNDDVQRARDCYGLDDELLEKLTPEQRAIAIACALLDYGCADEGPAGWSTDMPDHMVEWSRGRNKSLRELLASGDDEFRREVLLADWELAYEKYDTEERENAANGLKVEASTTTWRVEITEWTDIEAANGEPQADPNERVVKRTATVDLDELLGTGEHRGAYSGDDASITVNELAEMTDDAERDKVVIGASIAWLAYHGGEEEFVASVGD